MHVPPPQESIKNELDLAHFQLETTAKKLTENEFVRVVKELETFPDAFAKVKHLTLQTGGLHAAPLIFFGRLSSQARKSSNLLMRITGVKH